MKNLHGEKILNCKHLLNLQLILLFLQSSMSRDSYPFIFLPGEKSMQNPPSNSNRGK